jgi:predicted enzyme related to lactoylglutathione lyase
MVTNTASAQQSYSSLFGRDIPDGSPEACEHLMCVLKGREVVAKAKEAINQFLLEPMDVMTSGRLAFMTDPTGVPSGIWQAGAHKGVVAHESGALVWNELMTRDHEGPKTRYGNVFGLTYEEVGEGVAYSMGKRPGEGEVVASWGELSASRSSKVPASSVSYFRVQNFDAWAAMGVQLGDSGLRGASTPRRSDGIPERRPARGILADLGII